MQTLKLSYLFFPHFESTIIFFLIKKLSKKKIELVSPDKSDLLIIGGFDQFSFKRKILNYILKKKSYLNYFKNLDIYFLKRKMNPLRIFYPTEYMNYDNMKSDYYISTHMGVDNPNHLRMPNWKDDIDWSHEGCFRERNMKNSNAIRFGKFHPIEDFLVPQGDEFLKKKGMCIFTSNLTGERKVIYSQFNKYYGVKGFGPYFNKEIKDHNTSNFLKIDIMKFFSFNLCPENSLHPGYYTEKVTDAFIGKCLPITWADKNIQLDFNKNAFINLIDYNFSNFKEVAELLKDPLFLKKFINEPLLLKKVDLEKEKTFIRTVLSNL